MDESRDHIDQKIAASFQTQERKAPEGLWSSIASSIALSKDEARIKESFTNASTAKAPEKAWKKVKTQLVIDDVWSRILAYQEKRRRRIIFWWWSGSLAGIFCIVLLLWQFYPAAARVDSSYKAVAETRRPVNNPDRAFTQAEHPASINETDVSNDTPLAMDPSQRPANAGTPGTADIRPSRIQDANITATTVSGNLATSGRENQGNLHQNLREFPSIGTSTESNAISEETTVTRENFVAVDPLHPYPLSSEFSTATEELANWNAPKALPFKHVEIGLQFFGGSTWLFNNDVKNGLSRSSLIQNRLSTGYNIGVEGIYKLNERHGIYAGYDFYSLHKQNYRIYRDGTLIDRNITLTQQKALLGYKFTLPNPAAFKRNIVLRVGAYYAHSIKEQAQLKMASGLPTAQFENKDFGINIGGGMEHEFKFLKVEYGIRSDIGLYNMTVDSEALPKSFDYATTFQVGFYTAIRYRF